MEGFGLAEEDHGALDLGPIGEDLPGCFGSLLAEEFAGVVAGAFDIFPENGETFFDLGFEMEG